MPHYSSREVLKLADIAFHVGGYKFNYRVAAIIEHRQRYLLSTVSTANFWFLPGGRVKAGESSLEAVSRELYEELGLAVQVRQLRWVVENFFTHNGQDFHEMSLYFSVPLPADASHVYEESFFTGPDLEFRWFGLEALQGVDLRPSFLKSELLVGGQGFKHIIFRNQKRQKTT